MLIRGVREDNGLRTISTQSLDIRGRIFDIQVGADGSLFLHETQVPVRDVVSVEPLDRLAHGDLVKVFDEEAMGNDPNSNAGLRESPEGLWRARSRWELQKQFTLHHRK